MWSQVDSCDRLWVLDTGKVGDDQVCPPQLLSFSLRTNKILSQYKFPNDHVKSDSLFVTPVVDVRDGRVGDKCRNTFVYVADVTEFALIVYDLQNSRSWRISNKLFFPYPPYGTYHIAGHTFDLMDGILGLALSPPKANGDKILYFHSLASRVESWVPTSVIRWGNRLNFARAKCTRKEVIKHACWPVPAHEMPWNLSYLWSTQFYLSDVCICRKMENEIAIDCMLFLVSYQMSSLSINHISLFFYTYNHCSVKSRKSY